VTHTDCCRQPLVFKQRKTFLAPPIWLPPPKRQVWICHCTGNILTVALACALMHKDEKPLRYFVKHDSNLHTSKTLSNSCLKIYSSWNFTDLPVTKLQLHFQIHSKHEHVSKLIVFVYFRKVQPFPEETVSEIINGISSIIKIFKNWQTFWQISNKISFQLSTPNKRAYWTIRYWTNLSQIHFCWLTEDH